MCSTNTPVTPAIPSIHTMPADIVSGLRVAGRSHHGGTRALRRQAACLGRWCTPPDVHHLAHATTGFPGPSRPRNPVRRPRHPKARRPRSGWCELASTTEQPFGRGTDGPAGRQGSGGSCSSCCILSVKWRACPSCTPGGPVEQGKVSGARRRSRDSCIAFKADLEAQGKRMSARRGALLGVIVEPSGLVAALSARRAVAGARLWLARTEQD